MGALGLRHQGEEGEGKVGREGRVGMGGGGGKDLKRSGFNCPDYLASHRTRTSPHAASTEYYKIDRRRKGRWETKSEPKREKRGWGQGGDGEGVLKRQPGAFHLQFRKLYRRPNASGLLREEGGKRKRET